MPKGNRQCYSANGASDLYEIDYGTLSAQMITSSSQKTPQKTDWEVELAIVIGKKASYVAEADAMDYVAGYVLHNDVSEREFQIERGGTWDKGKGCDTFAPLSGRFLPQQMKSPDPHNLQKRLWLKSKRHKLMPGWHNGQFYI